MDVIAIISDASNPKIIYQPLIDDMKNIIHDGHFLINIIELEFIEESFCVPFIKKLIHVGFINNKDINTQVHIFTIDYCALDFILNKNSGILNNGKIF